MKRIALFLSLPIIGVIFLICSCSVLENNNEKMPDILILTKAEEATASGSNQIGFKLLTSIENQQIESEERENVIVSPLSYSMAMAMLWNGAANETKEVIKNGLGFGDFTDEEVNSYFGKILEILPTTDPKTKVSLANSIWYQNGYTLEENFIDVNNRYFNAEISPIDFSDNKSINIINNWCSDKTNGKIDKMVEQFDPDLVAMLINALYFKGEWSSLFEKSDTKEAIFYSSQGEKRADMMYQQGYFSTYKNELFQAINLPYGNNAFSMTVILPAKDSDIISVLNNINDNDGFWSDIIAGSSPTTIDLYLPNFKFEYEIDLNDFVKECGMGMIYSPLADFSNMMKQQLSVSNVKQKAIIEVDEKGTEAAAVTTVEIVYTSLPTVSQFRADRPFIFIISENSSSSILFIGKVEDPR